MFNPNLPEPDLVKTILQPLLDDFQYWFGRSQTLLETERVTFLSTAEQSDLLARVKQAQQEVHTTQMLMQVTNGEVGVETTVLMMWHHLVTECWQIAIRFRLSQASRSQE